MAGRKFYIFGSSNSHTDNQNCTIPIMRMHILLCVNESDVNKMLSTLNLIGFMTSHDIRLSHSVKLMSYCMGVFFGFSGYEIKKTLPAILLLISNMMQGKCWKLFKSLWNSCQKY